MLHGSSTRRGSSARRRCSSAGGTGRSIPRDCYGARQYYMVSEAQGVPSGCLTGTMRRRTHSNTVCALGCVSKALKELGVGSIAFAMHLGLAPDEAGIVSTEELKEALTRRPVELSALDLSLVMADLGCDEDGAVSIRELVTRARGTFPSRRAQAVKELWSLFDPYQTGEIAVDAFFDYFRPQQHPRVRARLLDPRLLSRGLQETLEAAAGRSGGIRFDDFDDYLRTQSLLFSTDEGFLDMLREVWQPRHGTQTISQDTLKGNLLAAEGTIWPQSDSRPRAASLGPNLGMPRPRSAAPHSHARAAATAPAQRAAHPTALATAPEKRAVSSSAAHPTAVATAPEKRAFSSAASPPDHGGPGVAARIRQALRQRGASNIAGIGRKFRIVDRDGSMKIRRDEFQVMLQQLSVPISTSEANELWSMFDADGGGYVDYEEFLSAIRGPMNERRRQLVNQLFDKMDADGSGDLTVSDIVSFYDCSKHPDVKDGKATPYEVLKVFLSNFDGGVKDGHVTRQEFRMYFVHVSAHIDNDDHFEAVVRQAWRPFWEGVLVKDRLAAKKALGTAVAAAVFKAKLMRAHKGHGRSNSVHSQNVPSRAGRPPANGIVPGLNVGQTAGQAVLERLRGALRQLSSRHIFGVGRRFRVVDDDGQRWLGHPEFSQLLGHLDITPSLSVREEEALWRHFDAEANGAIDYDAFLRAVCGGMSPRRSKMVDVVFNQLGPGQHHSLDVYDLHNRYDAQKEPTVLQGKQESGEALRAFVCNFDAGTEVTQKEFRMYHEALSASIDNDEQFASVLCQLWKVDMRFLR